MITHPQAAAGPTPDPDEERRRIQTARLLAYRDDESRRDAFVRQSSSSPVELRTCDHEARRCRVIAQIPLGRFGEPDAVGVAVAYLAGPGGAWVTGQVLHVNGGMYM